MPDILRNCEPALIEAIENEIMDSGDPITFKDIGGSEREGRSRGRRIYPYRGRLLSRSYS